MNRSELIARICDRFSQLTALDTEQSVKVIQEALINELIQGGRIEIRGFGSFKVYSRPPRAGRNPRTGKDILITEKCVLQFKPSTELRKRVNVTASGCLLDTQNENLLFKETPSGWVIFRALLVVEAYTKARQTGESYEFAVEAAINAINSFDSSMEINSKIVEDILKQYMSEDTKEVLLIS